MAPHKAKPLSEEQIAALLAKFGPAPVLSSEDKEGYAALLNGHIAFYRPAHPMVVFLIKQLAETQWEIFRFTRNRSVSIERRYLIWRDDRIAQLERKNKERKQHLKTLNDFTNAQRQAIYQVELTIKKTETAIKELATRGAAPIEENVVIEQAGDFLDKSDKWLITAMARQNNLLQLLEYHCGPADQRNEVPEVEFKEVQDVKQIAAPPIAPTEENAIASAEENAIAPTEENAIVPTEENANDLATQNPDEPGEREKE
jgi:hypothetical protein